MNTEKTHERFWEAMRARFGKRWLDEFGPAPTAPWVQLVNEHTPLQVRKALELMGQEKLQHPPTLPQFEVLLERATRKAPADDTNWVRGYWRSVIVAHLTRHLQQLKLATADEQVEQYVVDHKATLGPPLRELLDELCDLEQAYNGQRTPGMYTRVDERVRQLLVTSAQEMFA